MKVDKNSKQKHDYPIGMRCKQIMFVLFAITNGSVLISAHDDTSPKNRVSLQVQAGFGTHLRLLYERRMNNLFGIETGAIGGENFIRMNLSRFHHYGIFVGTNFYFTNSEEVHQLYLSPSIAITYGNASIPLGDNWKDLSSMALDASVFFAYRYMLSFGVSLEAGIGVDVATVLFPLERGESSAVYSLPFPKIQFGFGYAL